MKHLFWLLLIVLASGCVVSEESVKTINQKIAARYSSFSTLKYSVTGSLYENGALVQKTRSIDLFKKPDKVKQYRADFIVNLNADAVKKPEEATYVCNKNTSFALRGKGSVEVYEYVNIPPEVTTYCNYAFFVKGEEVWEIPTEITDATKYRVETSKETYNGKNAVKAVVTVLLTEEEKKKQLAIGKAPRESVNIYWFDAGSFAILKEEFHSIGTACDLPPGSEELACRDVEIRSESVYESFEFDAAIPDSEFEIALSNYAEVRRETVDWQQKFD